MEKYTVIWVDHWVTGSLHHSNTRKTWVEAESMEVLMQEYGDYAVYIFPGHILTIGEEFDQSKVDIIEN